MHVPELCEGDLDHTRAARRVARIHDLRRRFRGPWARLWRRCSCWPPPSA